MKHFMILLLSAFLISGTHAQVSINTDGSYPDNSAILDVKSSTKGVLIPRLTQLQIQAIQSPANGLQVFCTDDNRMYIFISSLSQFKEIAFGPGTITPTPYNVGQSYGGGIIFYVDGTGQHGLIAATSDQSLGAQWGCYGVLIGCSATAIGTGQANTNSIVTGCNEPGIAARICYDLELNGFSDWFLPSKDELNEMYLHKNLIGGFNISGVWYISSSEDSAWGVEVQRFSDGAQGSEARKDNSEFFVRAIRSF